MVDLEPVHVTDSEDGAESEKKKTGKAMNSASESCGQESATASVYLCLEYHSGGAEKAVEHTVSGGNFKQPKSLTDPKRKKCETTQ